MSVRIIKLLCNKDNQVLVDGKESLLDAIGKYCGELNYQNGNKHRIGALLSLKDTCSYYESEHFYEDLKESGYPEIPVTISSFFSHVKSICDQSLMFFICSEISNSVEARPLSALIEQLFNERHYDGTIFVKGESKKLPRDSVNDSFNCLQDLFVNRYDSTVGSHIFDFKISIFSAFECWVDKACENYAEEMNEKLSASRLKKYEKLLKKYENSAKNDDLRKKCIKDLRKIPGEFISFPDKFNFVLSKADANCYPRDVKYDRALVDFLRAARNSVHNGGIHRGKDIEFTHKGVTHKLTNNQAMYHDDYNDLFDLCAELVVIYESILCSIKPELDKKLIRTIMT